VVCPPLVRRSSHHTPVGPLRIPAFHLLSYCVAEHERDEEVVVTMSEQAPRPPGPEVWNEAHSSAEFVQLRKRLRGFVFPMASLFLGWYLLYVLLADYAHGFMSTRVVGNINVGLIFGLLQFVSTFVITGLYVWFANRKLDPIADKIRGDIEGSER
jgi:uncharacterized membrane protein (DUF485 family)